MMTCERCGKEIPDNIAICPNCGTVTSTVRSRTQPPTKHGPYSGSYIDVPPDYAYPPRQNYATPPLKEYSSPQQNYGYGQPYNAPPMYQSAFYNVTVVNTTNNTPLIIELLLSIFLGLYGVGWLMAGETAIGVILLVCSVFIYLPLFFVSIFIAPFTFGFSLLCTIPMVIGAIVLNAILLNNRLKQKAAQYMTAQPK